MRASHTGHRAVGAAVGGHILWDRCSAQTGNPRHHVSFPKGRENFFGSFTCSVKVLPV